MLLLTQGRWQANELMCVTSALYSSWSMGGAQKMIDIVIIIISYLSYGFIESP